MSILDALSLSFMQNALMAAVLASLATGVIGALVVVNRLVFMAGGVAHSAYGGVGLGLFMGWPIIPSAVGFTLGASLLMGAITRKRKEQADTVIGVLWAAGMAFGILLIDLTPGYNVELMSYLFGSILSVPRIDVLMMLGLDVVLLLLVALFYRDLLALSFDEEFARTRGVKVDALYFLLLGTIAVTVVLIIQVVGLLLVIALFTIPPYLAQRHARSLAGMMVAATLWSLFFCLAGLTLSYGLDLSSGAAIIAVAAATFLLLSLKDRLLPPRSA